MAVNIPGYTSILSEVSKFNASLVAVSKTKPAEDIVSLYTAGQRIFGENYVQELTEKYTALPKDIQWHFIGHLQSNKVKYIAPFVSLVQSVDSLKLLKEINKQALKHNRTIDCLLQIHIASEETKFGLDEQELSSLLRDEALESLLNIKIVGLMGMASFTDDQEKVRQEYRGLKKLFDTYSHSSLKNCQLEILSMGMSADYKLALEEGSTLVRIGSLLFGERSYTT